MIRSASNNRLPRSQLPSVVLVEPCDGAFNRLKQYFATAGFRVVRAKSSAEAVKHYIKTPADLLVVDANRAEELAWLLIAKLQLTHPNARIWAYVVRPSRRDVAAANLLAIEELIEYDSTAEDLESQLLDRLGVSPHDSMPSSRHCVAIDSGITGAFVLP